MNLRLIILIVLLATANVSLAQNDSTGAAAALPKYLDLNVKGGIYEDAIFGAHPGAGFELQVVAPFLSNRLRLGFGFGTGLMSFNADHGSTYVPFFRPTEEYTGQLEVVPVTFELGIGTDLLATKKASLVLEAGLQLFVAAAGTLVIEDIPTIPLGRLELKTAPSLSPAVTARLSYALPIGKRSYITFGYSFTSVFGKPRLKDDQVLNGVNYNDRVANLLFPPEYVEEYMIVFLYDSEIGLRDGLLNVPDRFGAQHGITIGYRYKFGLSK